MKMLRINEWNYRIYWSWLKNDPFIFELCLVLIFRTDYFWNRFLSQNSG
ncbi:MAG: hypothetical protein Ta2E_00420 [Mycoplasmoidaceae bacterium]|nr:MAG: hypothetical protein Ta2E_00420 [Mycoplasmoidaceae bacterium]